MAIVCDKCGAKHGDHNHHTQVLGVDLCKDCRERARKIIHEWAHNDRLINS